MSGIPVVLSDGAQGPRSPAEGWMTSVCSCYAWGVLGRSPPAGPVVFLPASFSPFSNEMLTLEVLFPSSVFLFL